MVNAMNKARYKTHLLTSLITLSALLIMLSSNSLARDNPRLRIITSIGSFTVELYHHKAPKSVQQILHHVDDGYYNGVIFHRVIKNFMVQTGAIDQQLEPLTPSTNKLQNEADNGLKNSRGTLAMARTADPHSAMAQFFINIINNPHLDHKDKSKKGWGYAVFGKVVSGMNVVRRLSRVPTNDNNLPLKAIIIKRISRI